jgi:hypothetical protein
MARKQGQSLFLNRAAEANGKTVRARMDGMKPRQWRKDLPPQLQQDKYGWEKSTAADLPARGG